MPLVADPFCTEAEIRSRYGEVFIGYRSDHDEDGTADTDAVEEAINYATAFIDGYLNRRYTTAEMVASPLVKSWAITIAAHRLSQSRGQGPSEILHAEYERAIEHCTQVWDLLISL